MSRLFLSHSSANNTAAVAIRNWLSDAGWDDVFLDVDPDPDRGIRPGERWERALNQAASRCEAVLFLVSQAWLGSSWCRNEFNLARRLNKRLFGALIEEIPIAKLPPELTGTWQIVDLVSGHDHEMIHVVLPRTHEESHVTFSREGLNRLRGGLAKSGIDPRFFAWPPDSEPKRPPYRGLKPLEAEDAGIFFGREGPIVEALDALRGLRDAAAPRLLVVLGASGAGKSSFLRAGLLPRLARDDLHFLPLPVIRPERAAVTGEETGLLHAVEAALAARGIAQSRANIRRAIGGGAAALRPLLKELVDHACGSMLLEAGAKKPFVMLAIDQAEELLQGDGAREGEMLLRLVRDLVAQDDPAIIVIFTIRSDSYDKLETCKALEGLRQQTLPLLPMPRGAYQQVIENPAKRLEQTDRTLTIEPQLIQKLLLDLETGGASDALPLLSFTMEQLYLEYGSTGALRLADYVSFGGIKGAITVAVDRALAAADENPGISKEPTLRLNLLRRGMIPLLAGIDHETGNPRRRIAKLADIPAEAAPLVLLLRDHKLLSTDRIVVRDEAGERSEITIEPAHEALLRQWDSLRGWLEEDRAALTTIETVKRAAEEWATNNRGADWLNHAGSRLEYAEKTVARDDLTPDLPADAREYLRQCRERDETERREKQEQLERERAEQERRAKDAEALALADRQRATDAEKLALANRRTAIGASAGLVIAMLLIVLFVFQWQKAQKNLAAAVGAISSLIAATSQVVQPIAQLDTVQTLIERARAIMNEFSATDDPTLALQRARTLLILAEIDWDRGDIKRMLEDADAASVYLAPLAKEGDLEARHQQARSNRLIGLAHWEANENEQARAQYQTAIAELTDLLKAHGDDENAWQWRRSLADVDQELGDVLLFRLHDIDGAAKAFDECYDTRVALTKSGHTDPVFFADVAWAANKHGDVQKRRGDVAGAIKWYDTARNDFLNLHYHLFDNLNWPHRVALIENNIGLMYMSEDQFRDAAAEFDLAVADLQRVVDRDPKNLYRLSALAWTYDNQGHATFELAAAGGNAAQLKTAEQAFSQALKLHRQIAAAAPEKVIWQLSVIESQSNVAATDAMITELTGNHLDAATGFARAADLILKGFAGQQSTSPDTITRCIEYLDDAGLEYVKLDDRKDAQLDFNRATQILRDNGSLLGSYLFERWQRRLQDHLQVSEIKAN